MKELIAKEFLFFFVGVLVAVPVGILFLHLVNLEPATKGTMTNDEKVLEMDLLLIGGLIGFIGVYLARFVAWAVKSLVITK